MKLALLGIALYLAAGVSLVRWGIKKYDPLNTDYHSSTEVFDQVLAGMSVLFWPLAVVYLALWVVGKFVTREN